jgi:glycosyltransferase involved in cell wall biosynthesis
MASGAFDAIVCVTPTIASRFEPRKTVLVRNFPAIQELVAAGRTAYALRPNAFVYVGVVAAIRGAREMVESIGRMTDSHAARLELAGNFSPAPLEDELRAMRGWERVRYHGWASRPQVASLLGAARAGLVVLHPTHNYPDAYPVKLFEYMAAGLPVIASDFPLWRSIVDGARCGLLVDPTNASEIRDAMRWILDHPAEAEAMGRRGAQAIASDYNWAREAETLLRLYERLA